MNEQNNNSIFENPNVNNMDTSNEVKNPNELADSTPVEENIVKPIVDKPDLADKTINAVENFINTDDHKNEYEEKELKQYKNLAIYSYVPFVSLYFIATKKYQISNYLKFHVNQGLNITIILVATIIISEITNAIFSKDSLVLNNTPLVISIIFYALYFIVFSLILFGISNTSNDKSKELPVIGKYKILK